MRKWPVVGGVLALIWVLVRGVDPTPARIAAEGVTGLLVGFPVAYGLRHFYDSTTDVGRRIRSTPYALLYVASFLVELLVANVEVAWRILSPSMPIKPAVVRLPLRVQTDVAITSIANTITLTPGTLTLDYDPEGNALLVHYIAVDDPAAAVEPIRRWEDYALRLFDEPYTPTDPPPMGATLVPPETFAESAAPLAEAVTASGDASDGDDADAGGDTDA